MSLVPVISCLQLTCIVMHSDHHFRKILFASQSLDGNTRVVVLVR